MNIRIAENHDAEVLCQYDKHIDKSELQYIISQNRVVIAEENGIFIGWLRYSLFWDNTPFMNMVYILESYRGKGYGKQIVSYWEEQMRLLNYDCVMTSTASNEYAQHFYVGLGYKTVGGFMFKDDPYEIILIKEI